MGKKLGSLIKTARTNAGFTQEQLARKVAGVSQSDIGRYERGEAEPTTQTVKDIAKACGVTQKSLLDAMPKSTTTRTTTTRSTSSSSQTSMRVTATEKRLVELYRAADSDTKKRALALLRGTDTEDALAAGVGELITGFGSIIGDVLKGANTK